MKGMKWQKGIKITIFAKSFVFLCLPEAATGGVLWKQMFLKTLQYSQENTSGEQSYQHETPTQLFSCEYYKIFKNYFKKKLENNAVRHDMQLY